jgi:hypothetical protein
MRERGRGWYRRRVPWIGRAVVGPARPPRALVVRLAVASGTARIALVRLPRTGAANATVPSRGTVMLRRTGLPPGLAVIPRPPRATPVSPGVLVRTILVCSPRLAPARRMVWFGVVGQPPASRPPDRSVYLPASVRTRFPLPSAVKTSFHLPALVRTGFRLEAHE